MDTYEELKAQYDRTFAEHRLEMVLNNGDFRGYYLRPKEGGRINSVLILFTPEGIVISGDHAPGRNGMCSNYGYDQAWFSSPKGAGYLAEKFGLQRQWQARLALSYLDTVDEDEEADDREERQELMDNIRTGDAGEHEFYAFLREANVDEWYDVAQGFDPVTLANLTAIQHAFARLMGELAGDKIKEVEPEQRAHP